MTKSTTMPRTLANRRTLVFFGGPLLISVLVALGFRYCSLEPTFALRDGSLMSKTLSPASAHSLSATIAV